MRIFPLRILLLNLRYFSKGSGCKCLDVGSFTKVYWIEVAEVKREVGLQD